MSAIALRDILHGRIDDQVGKLGDILLSGKAKDYADYLAKCAEIKAYINAKKMADEEVRGMHGQRGAKR